MNITRFPPAESGTSINEQPKTVGKPGTNTGDGGRGNGCAESQASPVFDGGIEWMPRGFIMLLSVRFDLLGLFHVLCFFMRLSLFLNVCQTR